MPSPLTMTTTSSMEHTAPQVECSPDQLLFRIGQAAAYSFLYAELCVIAAARTAAHTFCLPLPQGDVEAQRRPQSPPVEREYWEVQVFDPYL